MNKKERLIHTINVDVCNEFKKLTTELTINRSALIEKMIKTWINEQKNK